LSYVQLYVRPKFFLEETVANRLRVRYIAHTCAVYTLVCGIYRTRGYTAHEARVLKTVWSSRHYLVIKALFTLFTHLQQCTRNSDVSNFNKLFEFELFENSNVTKLLNCFFAKCSIDSQLGYTKDYQNSISAAFLSLRVAQRIKKQSVDYKSVKEN